jgi:hypothetical protein
MKFSSIAALFIFLILSFNVLAEEVEIETRSHTTADGVTHIQKLALELTDLEASPKFDPSKDVVPLSIKEAINLATTLYIKQTQRKEFSLGNISLNRFPHYKYRDKWFYQIEIIGNPFKGEPSVLLAVLLTGKVVMSVANGT